MYLLEVAVEFELGLVAGLHFGAVADQPHGLLEARLQIRHLRWLTGWCVLISPARMKGECNE